MKRRINLFSHAIKRFDAISVVKKTRLVLIILIFILISGIGVGLFINSYLTSEIDSIEKSKKPLLQYFQTNTELDKKVNYFTFKYSLLKEYLKQDADVYSYYLNLKSIISGVAPNAVLSTVSIDNTGKLQFSLLFPSYDESQSFLSALEDSSFIEAFEYLKLSDFDIAAAQSSGFQLEIEGKFIKK